MVLLDNDKLKTVDNYGGKKSDLIKNNHPVIRLLREIPELIFEEQEGSLPGEIISLKELFGREMIDKYHIDSSRLILIAGQILEVLDQIAVRKICPGLYDIADIYVESGSSQGRVFFCHPERFQLLEYEQDYEWYPEDEKIFGEIELFETESQQRADCRLIYKVLVASTKGNVKVPPKITPADYSEMFYQKLTPDLKRFFDDPAAQTREHLKELLTDAWEEIQSGKKDAPKDFREDLRQGEESGREADRKAGRSVPCTEGKMQCMYILLRTDLQHSEKTGRMLYNIQDAMETQCRMAHYALEQSFVYGDGVIHVRKMNPDPEGFRVQLKSRIKNYAAGEALIIASDYYEEILRLDDEDVDRCCIIIFDGELQNSALFQWGIKQLIRLKEQGVRFYLVSGPNFNGEACQKLCGLIERQEDHYVDQTIGIL